MDSRACRCARTAPPRGASMSFGGADPLRGGRAVGGAAGGTGGALPVTSARRRRRRSGCASCSGCRWRVRARQRLRGPHLRRAPSRLVLVRQPQRAAALAAPGTVAQSTRALLNAQSPAARGGECAPLGAARIGYTPPPMHALPLRLFHVLVSSAAQAQRALVPAETFARIEQVAAPGAVAGTQRGRRGLRQRGRPRGPLRGEPPRAPGDAARGDAPAAAGARQLAVAGRGVCLQEWRRAEDRHRHPLRHAAARGRPRSPPSSRRTTPGSTS